MTGRCWSRALVPFVLATVFAVAAARPDIVLALEAEKRQESVGSRE